MGVRPRLRRHRQGEGAWVMGGGEFPLDDVQESSPLVKLQDAARATAEMWPRLNGASPSGNGLGTGLQPRLEPETGLEPGTGTGLQPAGPGLEPRSDKGREPHRAGPGMEPGLQHPPAGDGAAAGDRPGLELGPPHAGSGNRDGAGAGNRGLAPPTEAGLEHPPPGAGTSRGRDPPRGARGQPGLPLPRGPRTGGSGRRIEGGSPRPWVAGGAAVPWLRGGAWGLPWGRGRAERARRQQRRGRAGPG